MDQALFRRFDDILHYQKPTLNESKRLLENRLSHFKGNVNLDPIAQETAALHHAAIVRACDDAIKETILSGKEKVSDMLLLNLLKERHSAYRKWKDE